MSEYTLREYKAEDSSALNNLWQQVFGDPEALVAQFLRRLPELGVGAVAVAEGKAVGAAYCLDGELCLSDGSVRPLGYLYAVAVSPEHRHQGLGARLSELAAELSTKRGAEFICTLPAEQSLYAWYQEIIGVSCALHRRAATVAAEAHLGCERLSAQEYLRRRELLLSGKNHLRLSPAAMEFAELFYSAFGGGLYGCGAGLCAAYSDGKTVLIKELLCPDGVSAQSMAASLAAQLGCGKAVFYLPAADGEAYIAAPEGCLPGDCIWNLSFD
jgi:predicted N-acetyltransferase YhbS